MYNHRLSTPAGITAILGKAGKTLLLDALPLVRALSIMRIQALEVEKHTS